MLGISSARQDEGLRAGRRLGEKGWGEGFPWQAGRRFEVGKEIGWGMPREGSP